VNPRMIQAEWNAPGPATIGAVKTHDNRRTVNFLSHSWNPLQARSLAALLIAAADWVEALPNSLDNPEVKA
jgi:hypothetical protein